MPDIARCPECGHAESLHGEMGYCRVYVKSKGECPCDGTPRWWAASAWPNPLVTVDNGPDTAARCTR